VHQCGSPSTAADLHAQDRRGRWQCPARQQMTPRSNPVGGKSVLVSLRSLLLYDDVSVRTEQILLGTYHMLYDLNSMHIA